MQNNLIQNLALKKKEAEKNDPFGAKCLNALMLLAEKEMRDCQKVMAKYKRFLLAESLAKQNKDYQAIIFISQEKKRLEKIIYKIN